MNSFIGKTLIVLLLLTVCSCKVKYSFTGASISPEVHTVCIPNIPNMASMVAPILSSSLTETLQDKFTRQTRLTLVREDGDLNFEGEITNYVSTPIAITGEERAAMNRLTITVRMKFTNRFEPKLNYDRTFSAYGDYSSTQLLQEAEGALLPEIIDKLVEDMFNAAVSNW